MVERNPLVAVRLALGDGADWAWTLTRRGADLADRLLGFVVRRGDAIALAGPESTVDGMEAVVEAAKFHLGTDLTVGGPGEEAAALPRTYGRDRLRLLPRSPRSVFAYWEVTAPTRARALAALGGAGGDARLVLRLHDAATGAAAVEAAWTSFDVEPGTGATSAYVALPRPSASCRAELGLRTLDGRFVPLVGASSVTLPPAAPATDTTVRWVELRPRIPPLATVHEPSGARLAPRR